MKRLFILLLLFGCTQAADVQEEQPQASAYLMAHIGDEHVEEAQSRSITVRAVRHGFSPEVIEVNHGDRVVLEFINTLEEGTSGRDSDDAVRIGLSGYNLEAFYHSGGYATLEFVAEKKGTFEFGDEAHPVRKGRLIVN